MSKKLLSLSLALCLVFTMLPMTAWAQEEDAPSGFGGEIISFAPLTETEKAVTTGTAVDNLELPKSLMATVRTVSGSARQADIVTAPEWEETARDISVTWSSDPIYDKDTEGIYVFTPVIMGYTVSAELPKVTVTVGEFAATAKRMQLLSAPLGGGNLIVNHGGELGTPSGGTILLLDNSWEGSNRWYAYDGISGITPHSGNYFMACYNPSVNSPGIFDCYQDISIGEGSQGQTVTLTGWMRSSGGNTVYLKVSQLDQYGLEIGTPVEKSRVSSTWVQETITTTIQPNTRGLRVTMTGNLTKEGAAALDDLSLTLSAPPAPANIAEIGSTGYATLQAAVDAVASNQTIKLLDNILLDNTVSITTNKDFTLDLSGKIIDGGSNVVIEHGASGKLTIKDSAIGGGGKITSANDICTIYLYVGEASDTVLEIISGTVSNTGAVGSPSIAIYNVYDGIVRISGGTVSTNSGTAIVNDYGGKVLIPSGTVTIQGGAMAMNTAPDLSTYAGVQISGDTLNAGGEGAATNITIVDLGNRIEEFKYLKFEAGTTDPSISINDTTVVEGNSGDTLLVFTITLSSSSSKTITLDYATANGTATLDEDYTAKNGTLTFYPGETNKTVSVTVLGDTTHEADETVLLNLSNPGNATIADNQGIGTIQNDDATVPGVPTIGTATAGNGEATVSFTAPASNGGASITSYTVTSNPGGKTATGANSPITVTGLTNGTSYTFTVTATNTAGTGPASAASNSVTPKSSQTITFANPGAQNFGTSPTLIATASSNLPVTFTSTTPGVCTITSDGKLTFHSAGSATIEAHQAGNAAYLPATSVSRTFTVNAVVPGAPTIGTVTAGNGEATVNFTAPASNGGATITGYTVTASPGGKTATGANSPITVTGLTNGTAYTFAVTATNSAGTGSTSAASNNVTPKSTQTITFANPGAQNFGTSPTLIATASSNLPVTFTSTTPGVCTITSDGKLTFHSAGSATIEAHQAGNAAYLPATSVSRTFTVNAVVPGAPTIGTVTAGNGEATVNFTAPASNGGATITGYTVTASPGGKTATGANSPITVTGLTSGTAYTFTVTATNTAGTSSASAASNSVTPKSTQTITFANPGVQNFGTSSKLTATSSSGLPVTFTSTTTEVCTITPDGELTFLKAGSATIEAHQAGNAAYLPAASVSQTFTINAVAPGRPTIGAVLAGNGEATVTFTAPASNGGASITGYTVTASPGGNHASGSSSPIKVTGLTNGTPYTFTVTATNTAGTGSASTASTVVVPAAPVAQIDGTTYDTLQEAVDAITEDNQIIKLLDNITLTNSSSSAITIASAYSFTLDLNGYTLDACDYTAIKHSGTGTLNITDSGTGGKITSTGYTSGMYYPTIDLNGNPGCTMTVSGGTVSATGNYTHAINVVKNSCIVNVSGGTVTAAGGDSSAIYVAGYNSIVNISDGIVSATADRDIAIYVYSGGCTVNISGGTVSTTASIAIAIYNSDSSTINVSDEAVITNSSIGETYAAIMGPNSGHLNISGGTVSAPNGIAVKHKNTTIQSGTSIIQGGIKAISEAPTWNGVQSMASTNYNGDPQAPYITAQIGNYKYLRFEPAASLTGMVTISGTLKYDQTLTATYSAGNNTGDLSYQWKRNGSVISGVITNTYNIVQADIGETLTCEVTSSVQTGSVSSDATDTIVKADGPAAPTDLTGVAPTTLDGTDGKITGTTALMEYANNNNFTGATDCTAIETTGLLAGTYYVRVKSTTTHEAGAHTTVIIPAGVTKIAVPAANTGLRWTGSILTGVNGGTGYTLSGEHQARAVGSYTAIAALQSGYAWNDNTTTTKTISWSIAKASGPAAPTDLTGVAPTTLDGTDGKITGTTALMEYANNTNFTGAIDCTAFETTGLLAGTYYVHVKSTTTHEAGAYTTVTIPAYVPVTLTGTVTISGIMKYGQSLTATYVPGNSTGTLSYQWKRSGNNIGTNTNTYTLVEADINQTLTCEITSTQQTGSVTSIATDTIAKADGPTVNSVSAVGCTNSGNNDGKLTGVTAAMEYKKSGAASYSAGTGSDITGLTSGTYLVRVKSTTTHNAGADSAITVAAFIPPSNGSDSGSSDSGTPSKTEGKIEKDQKRDENTPTASLNDSTEDLKSKVFSTEEQTKVATGKDAKVILKIEDISASVSEEDKKQIEEKLAAEQQNTTDTALLYIDISLFKKIGDEAETRVTETSGKISISIEVPETMWRTEGGIDRTYRVIRIHNGVAEVLEGTYDPITHLFTFETDRFSTYALTYQDLNLTTVEIDESKANQAVIDQDFSHLLLTAKAAGTDQKLSYAKVTGADGYLIYGAKCGQELKLLAEVVGTVTDYKVSNLKPGTYYKYQVKAYRLIKGEKVILMTSKLIHSVTENKTYANPSKITSDTVSVKLAVGENKTMNCKVVLPKGKKWKEHTAAIRYEASNREIATVNSKGKITAKGKGTCYVYAYAQNGVYKKIKVTVE